MTRPNGVTNPRMLAPAPDDGSQNVWPATEERDIPGDPLYSDAEHPTRNKRSRGGRAPWL